MSPIPLQVASKRLFSQPKEGENGYQGFKPGTHTIYPAGTRALGQSDTRPISVDIRVDHDVCVTARDGVRLYMDVYRPASQATAEGVDLSKLENRIPAILSWSPYGKKYSALDMLPITTWHTCVKRSSLSGLEKFEGVDPAEWCARGYAVVSVDTRGFGHSDGSIVIMGTQEGEDGHDVVEAVAAMDWCNGRVGMAGNSYLAISQWFIASTAPPSLRAIAPWEGASDLYREQFCRGGWFSMSNFDLITKEILRGPANSGVEDFAEMYRRSPTMNAFWADKRVDMTKIQCPVYIRGSDVSNLHNMGSIRAWMEIPHSQKWIRWGSYQEWYELYECAEAHEELFRFMDRYFKDEQNGWEQDTPKVRWTALRYGDRGAVHDIVLEDYPVPNTEYQTLYAAPGGKLVDSPPTEVSTLSYNSEDRHSWVEFTHTFPEPTRLIGIPKTVLYMSAADAEDFTVFVILRKKDRNGRDLMHMNFPVNATPVASIHDIPKKEQNSTNLHLGPMGILRASQRHIDPAQNVHPHLPFHTHDRQEFVAPAGTVVKLEIGIWALGVDYEAGERISLRVGGQFPSLAEYANWSAPRPAHELNHGHHSVYFGGDCPSHLILPYIPTSVGRPEDVESQH